MEMTKKVVANTSVVCIPANVEEKRLLKSFSIRRGDALNLDEH